MFPYLIINTTSLFFHNRRFGTPPTKKDIVNEVKEWTQNVLLPPLKKQRILATGSTGSRSTSLKANLNLKKTAITAIPGTAKSTSCAIVIDSTTEVLKKRPALGTKRQAEDLESTSDLDADNKDEGTAFNLRYEGLDEDEDDCYDPGPYHQFSTIFRHLFLCSRSLIPHSFPYALLGLPPNHLTSHLMDHLIILQSDITCHHSAVRSTPQHYHLAHYGLPAHCHVMIDCQLMMNPTICDSIIL